MVTPALLHVLQLHCDVPRPRKDQECNRDGTQFFPASVVPRFVGYALEPTVEQVVEATVSCKQQQLHLINIKNWLPAKQRFEVSYTITQSTGDKLPQIQVSVFFSDRPPGEEADSVFPRSTPSRLFATVHESLFQKIQTR